MCPRKRIVRMLLAGILLSFVSACGRQASQDALTQLNARLDRLEQKMIQLEKKDAELTELTNDAKATSIKLEEAISELNQQLAKMAPRPSPAVEGKPAQAAADVAPGKKHHVVAPGETLYSIARRYGLSVDDLRRINHLSQDRPIQAGQKLAVAR